MTSTRSGGADELDFRLLFGEDTQQRPAGPAGVESNIRSPANATRVPGNQAGGQDQCTCLPPVLNPSPLQTSDSYQPPVCQTQSSHYSFLRNPTAFGCPSIQITSISNSHAEVGSIQDDGEPIGAEGGFPEQTWSRDHLFLSLDPCYRDAALSTSPCSSLSSRSWLSDISSCESFSQICDDVEGDLNEAAARFTLGSPLTSPLASPGCGGGAFGVELWQQKYQDPHAVNQALSSHQSPRQSPCPSPRYSPCTSVTEDTWLNPRPTSRSPSRPTSPGGKRRHSNADVQAHSPSPHHSPTPTPGHSPRGSVTEDTWLGSPAGAQGPLLYCCQDLDVPSKTRRTTGTQLCLLTGQKDSGIEEVRAKVPVLDSPGEECGKREDLADLFLPVPSRFSWNKPEPPSAPLFRSSSLPPLDWALPSQYGPCELYVEVQPKSHHRAHYETEGSRGSIKAASGGHPVVKLNGYKEQPVSLQVYIGTADDRYLRPHAFYQVHRVTGKTVSTACQERFVDGSKVLEMALHPEHNMSASIDCAGILKLRNADIELRKGETDVGRKNTRVRVVFRVSIPQPNDKMLCLQTASVPVECSQRSALELPQVEHFSPTSSSVDGGQEMVVSGSNISCHSKVFFMEKGPDGRTRWEVDVKVVPEKSRGSRIVVKIPPYHNKTPAGHVQVQFYVSNGKRKRSQTLSFTYLDSSADLMAGAPMVKQEPSDLDYIPHIPLSSPDRAFCLDIPFPESCGQQVPYDRPFQSTYSQLDSFSLKGHQAHSGQPRMNAMDMGDLMPASQTAPHGVPYINKSNSNVQYTDSVLANRTILAQTNMAASSSRGETLYQSPIRTNLHLPESGDSSHSSAPSFLLGHHSPLGGSGLMPKVDPHSSPSSTSTFSLHSSSGGPARQQSPSLARGTAFLTPDDPQKFPPAPHSLFCSTWSGEMTVNIKQEEKEKLSLGTLALQAITLDDVNEIIDRDIYGLSGGSGQVQSDQDPCVWEEDSSGMALSFCGRLQ